MLVSKNGNPNHRNPMVDSFIDPIGPTMSNKGLCQGMTWNREGKAHVTAAVADCFNRDVSTADCTGKCSAREENSPERERENSIGACTFSFHTFTCILMQCVNQHVPPDDPRVTSVLLLCSSSFHMVPGSQQSPAAALLKSIILKNEPWRCNCRGQIQIQSTCLLSYLLLPTGGSQPFQTVATKL